MGARARLTTIVAALAALAMALGLEAQEALRVVYTVDQSNPEQVQVIGTVFNDSMQDVFDVSVTAEALDARGKVVPAASLMWAGACQAAAMRRSCARSRPVTAAVRYRAAVSAARAGVSPQAP